MIIQRLKVQSLHGNKSANIDLTFHKDLNILTGKNGSGKTTILKLLWYLISGNLERIPREINFDSAAIETDSFLLNVEHIPGSNSKYNWKLELLDSPNQIINLNGLTQQRLASLSDSPLFSIEEVAYDNQLEELNQTIVNLPASSSVFFPTFRRIEGGFSMKPKTRSKKEERRFRHDDNEGSVIARAMSDLSDRLSVSNNIFVSSIFTDDIVDLLAKHQATYAEVISEDQKQTSRTIAKLISEYEREEQGSTSQRLEEAKNALDQIRSSVAEMIRKQERLFQPFTQLIKLATAIFQHKGIKLSGVLTLGDAAQAISSDLLSAGEKQMLSFLAYNIFTKNSILMIDEPEISLHVDWQRILLSTLLLQESNNQFFIATHSPFIYSKYPEKELQLDADRGG